MMKNIFLSALSAFVLCAIACVDTAPSDASVNSLQPEQRSVAAPPAIFRGAYRRTSKGAFFYNCSTAEWQPVAEQPAGLDSLYREACMPTPVPDEPVYAVVQAVPRGGDSLAILRVDTLSPRTMRNSCLPYEFWCLGTEPFWGAVVSEEGVSLKMIGSGQGLWFPAPRRVPGEGIWTYESTDPKTKTVLRLQIKKEPCSDGMSDRQYDYSVQLRRGDELLRGCAVRGEK